jgi:hypothetical protein
VVMGKSTDGTGFRSYYIERTPKKTYFGVAGESSLDRELVANTVLPTETRFRFPGICPLPALRLSARMKIY